MATAIYVDIVDEDGTVKVSHVFWGETEAEARNHYEEHAGECAYFRAAIDDDRVIEDVDKHAERPEVEIEGEEIDEEETDEEDDAA